jgi:hypothetical protein
LVGCLRIFPASCGLSGASGSLCNGLAGRKPGFCASVSASKISVPRSSGDRFGDCVVGPQFEPYCLHHPVSASHPFSSRRQIGRFCGDFRPLTSGTLVSAGVHAFWDDFWRPVSASKNSVPSSRAMSARLDRTAPRNSDFWAAVIGILDRRGSYSGLRPSASNCRPHSVGGSRSRSIPMPRGRRPSTAALTRLGARKASEMVILTCRTLHFSRTQS